MRGCLYTPTLPRYQWESAALLKARAWKGETDLAKVPPPPGPADHSPGNPDQGQELAVLYAAYGNGGNYADATAKVQRAVKGATVDANPDQLGLPDVAFGRHKAFVIVYRSGGRILLSITPQEGIAHLGPAPMKP